MHACHSLTDVSCQPPTGGVKGGARELWHQNMPKVGIFKRITKLIQVHYKI